MFKLILFKVPAFIVLGGAVALGWKLVARSGDKKKVIAE